MTSSGLGSIDPDPGSLIPQFDLSFRSL